MNWRYLFRSTKAKIVLASGALLAAQCSEASLSASDIEVVDGVAWHQYGARLVGSSVTQAFTITNTGDADAVLDTVSDEALFGTQAGGAFSVTGGSCRSGAVLPAGGGTCMLAITFSPKAVLRYSSEVRLTYAWAGSAIGKFLSFSLAGTGANLGASVAIVNGEAYDGSSPALQFDYGPKAQGTTLTRTFTVANLGVVDARLGTISERALGLGAPFSLVGGTCASGALLPAVRTDPGQGAAIRDACTLIVRFAPTALGSFSANVQLAYDPLDGSSSRVAAHTLTGAGTEFVPVRQLSAGPYHTCALLANGKVRCWGAALGAFRDYYSGDLGDDELPLSAGDVPVQGEVVQIAAGASYTCALIAGGKVRCWGSNNYGVLGYTASSNELVRVLPSEAGYVNIGGDVKQISAGGYHACALLATGRVRCWGYNALGQLGYGNLNPIPGDGTPATAGDVDVGGDVVQIAAGSTHTCALLSNGSVRCWGEGIQGELGYGNTNSIGDDELPSSAGDVSVGGDAVQIAAGGRRSCALLSNGGVRCWGQGYFTGLGYGNKTSIGDDELPSSAGDIEIGGPAVQVSVGAEHMCAVLAPGRLRCWGDSYFGQLGYGNRETIGDNELPEAAGDVSVGGLVAQVSAGSNTTCAVLANGLVRCWGYKGEGMLGLGLSFYLTPAYDTELPSSRDDVPLQ